MSEDQLAIASLLSGNLAAARASLTAELVGRLRAHGLGMRAREFALGYVLAAGEGIAPGEAAEYLSMSAPVARRAFARLTELGWAETETAGEDRRFRSWRATRQGRETLAALLSRPANSALSEAIQKLSDKERTLLESHTRKLLVALIPRPACPPPDAKLIAEFERACKAAKSFGDHVAIWFQFTRLYRSMREEQMRFLATATDNVLDSASYMALYRAGERRCILADVATFLRVDQNTAVRVVDRLEAVDLVQRRRNPSNRRQMLICPTDKGKALLADVPPLDREGAYFGAISALPDRGRGLAHVLHKFASRYLDAPVVDSTRLYSLFTEVQLRAERRDAPPVRSQDFRKAMSNFLTGVAVVTVAGDDGPRGVTVNSLTSVSLEPPILLICFDRRSGALKRVQDVGAFGVNILASSQKYLAQRFSHSSAAAPFEPIDSRSWVVDDGVPLLNDSLVRITCELEQTFEAGSHTVVFGRPRQVRIESQPGSESALGYWRSGYLEVH